MKKGETRNISLTISEAKALLFWATIAVNGSNSGEYRKEILNIIIRLTKEFGWKQEDFCAIGYESGILGRELVDRLNKERGLRIKLR